MKYNNRHMLLLVAALVLSCTKEQPQECFPAEESDCSESSVTVSIADEDPTTRTSMSPLEGTVYKVLWGDEDELAIGKDGNFKKFSIGKGSGTKVATFTGATPVAVNAKGYFAASYPYDEASASDDGTVTSVGNIVPSTQIYMQDSFAPGSYPMVSVSTDGIDYQMRNLAGVVQIPVKGTGRISGVYFFGNNGEHAAGEVIMDFDSSTGEPVASDNVTDFNCKLSRGSQSARKVYVASEDGIELDPDTPVIINIVVVPQVFSKGFTIMFEDENGGRSKVQGYLPQTVRRSWTLRMKTVTYKTPQPLETANCYIINEAGINYFPAFCMGNRQECKLPTEGRDLDATILWSDCGMDVVSDIEYFVDKNGRGNISFDVKKDLMTGEARRGNAVICLYDRNTNEILWSWHLWLTQTPKDVMTGGQCAAGTYTTYVPNADGSSTAVTFESNATSKHLLIMDRNLGAISADPQDGWKTYGLYYQMGRKDPFIGGQSEGSPTDRTDLTGKGYIIGDENLVTVKEWESSPFSAEFTKPTEWDLYLTNGWLMSLEWINLTRSIREPMTMSSHNLSGSTLWTDYSSKDNMSYMDPDLDKGSTNGYGHTGLQSSGHEAYWNRTKTIFDPCPAGYTVLGERGGSFFDKDTFTASNEGPAYGITSHFTYDGTTYDVWWPAAGMRSTKGTMIEVGYRGSYFYFDHINATHGAHGMSFYVDGSTYKMDYSTSIITNHASSIRCVKAKQL